MTGHATRTFAYEAEAFRSYCQRAFETPLDYNFDSVALVDGILGEAGQSLKGMNEAEAWTFLNNMTLAAGGFLGEVLVRTCGGTWGCAGNEHRLQDWVVNVPWGTTTRTVPVFAAVFQFLQKGPNETLLALVAPFLKPDGTWPKAFAPTRRTAKKAAKPARRLAAVRRR